MTDNPLNEAFFQSMESSIVDVLDAETLPPACYTSEAFFEFEKEALFKLLDAEDKIGVKLTESYAMWPGASVSGMYFSHPQSEYFGVGKIEKDQVVEYAERKGMELRVMERWLAPILNYTPGQEPNEEAA